eukprot:2119329-Heterocapsa_arctica.AAC.1
MTPSEREPGGPAPVRKDSLCSAERQKSAVAYIHTYIHTYTHICFDSCARLCLRIPTGAAGFGTSHMNRRYPRPPCIVYVLGIS